MRLAGPWRGVTDAPVDRLGVLVVIAGHPGGAAAGLPVVALPGIVTGLALAGDGEGAPQLLAVLGIVCGDVTAHAEFTAGAADDDLALDDQRHQGHVLALLVVLHLGVPHHLAGLGVERDDMVVGGGEIELVLPEADAAVGRMQLEQVVGKLPLVAPIFVAGLRVQRDHLPHRGRYEHHAIVDDRRRLVAFDHAGGKGPDRCEILDVRGVDLVERAVALPVIGAPIEHPVAGFRIFQPLLGDRRVVLDRAGDGGGRDKAREGDEAGQ